MFNVYLNSDVTLLDFKFPYELIPGTYTGDTSIPSYVNKKIDLKKINNYLNILGIMCLFFWC